MKPTRKNPLLRNFLPVATLCLTLGQASHAATLYWDGAATATWGTLANWSTASGATTPDPTAEPGANDDVIFNITTANSIAQIVTLASNKSALSLTFNNTLTTLVRSDNTTTRTLTLGNGGLTVNSGAGTVTIGAAANGNQVVVAGSQNWINNSSSSAILNNTIGRSNGSVLKLSPGTGTFTATVHALSNGLMSTWAATGSGTSLRYLTKTSNVVGPYSAGTAAADAASLTDTLGTVNYDLAAATGTTPATVSANTIRFTGAAGTLAPGATSFTARGLMNAGTGKWTIGSNPITIGSTNELIIIANSEETEITSPILNNGVNPSAVSYHGAGTLTLSGDNAFTNGLNIGAGKVLVNHPGALNSLTPNAINFNGTSGTLALNGNTGLSVTGLSGLGSATIPQANQIVENANVSGVNLNIGGASTSSTFYGVLRDGIGGGSLGITKVGTGTLTLFGTNTFTGTSLINQGVLAVGSTSALPGWDTNGRFSVAGGAILAVYNAVTDGNIDSMLDTTNFTAGSSIGFDTTTANRTYAAALTDTSQGALGLAKTGTNALTLNQANSYSGITSVINGTLTIQNAGALGTTAGATSVTSTGRLELEGGITVAGEPLAISGGGGANFFNGALNSKSGINKWTGNITINANDTRIGAQAGASIEVSGVIDSGVNLHTVIFRPADTTATVIVSGPNTYVGATSLTGGLVNASSLNSVVGGTASSNFGAPTTVATGTITFGGAEGSGLRYTGGGETTDRVINLGGTTQGGRIDQSGSGELKFTSAFTATGAGSKTLTLQGSTAGTGEIAGAIVDNSATNKTSLTKAGTGTWTLSGTNTNTGNTTVNGGTLKLNYGVGGTDFNKLPDAGTLTFGGGTLDLVGGTHAEVVLSTTLATNTASRITRTSGGAVVQLNAITRNTGASIDFGTTGIATTDTPNNTSGILGTWATVGGTDWATNSTNLADGFITAYTGYTDLSTSGIIVDGPNSNVRINSNGGGGNMTLGSLTTTINTLLQNNTAQPAVIDLQSTRTLATSAIMIGTNSMGLTVGSVLDDGFLTAATPGGDLLLRNNSPTQALTINSAIVNNTSASSLTKVGVGTAVLAGTNTYTGATNLAEGTLKAGSSAAFGGTSTLVMGGNSTFDLGGFNASFTNLTATAANTITTTGPGSGVDTLTISAMSATSGALFTDNGIRKLALSVAGTIDPPVNNVANTFSGGLIVGSTARVPVLPGTVGGPGAITSGPFGRGPITVNGGNVFNTGAQIWFSASNRTLVNDVIVNGNGGMGSRGGTFRIGTNTIALTGLVASGTITANLADAWFGCDATADGSALLLSGQLTGNSGFRFFQSSNSFNWTTTLNNLTANPNDYAGPTTINSSKTTLALGAANQIPNGPGKGNVILTSGTLDLAGFNETINGLTGAGTLDNVATGTTNTLTLGDGDATGLTFSGVIRNTNGTLALTKTGTGTQTLSGPNEYDGATTVNGGTLLINGSQTGATGPVEVNAATLGGTGTLGGAVTVASGGTLAPGTDGSVESLAIEADTTIAGTFACDIDGATTDVLEVNGNLTLTGSTLDINVVNTGTPGTYVIATYTGERSGSLSGTLPSGYDLNYDDVNNTIELIVTGTPYQIWIDGYLSITGLDKLSTADPDFDGLTNYQEFAFGLIPDSGSSVNPILVQLDKSNGRFTYQRLADSGLDYTIWTSDDLATWTRDDGAVQTPTTVGDNESVLVTLSGAKPLTATKIFVRVKAE